MTRPVSPHSVSFPAMGVMQVTALINVKFFLFFSILRRLPKPNGHLPGIAV
jgi:hypothetical protein